MAIRQAKPTDVHLIVELEQAVFGADAWTRTAVGDELAGAARVCLVDADPAAAWASILVAGDDADLTRIGVRPEARRSGRGRALLARACEEARSRGAARLLLEVARHNEAAVALYTSDGFVRVATRSAYYADGSDAVVMERTLGGA